MNEFHYNKTPEEQAAEKMLRGQNRRLASQQMIFAFIFFAAVALVAFYIVTRTVYAEYDGYINLDENHIRAMDDICVLDVYKSVGDSVAQGDTLFSYILLSNVLGQHDINTIPGVIRESNDMELQARLAMQEIPVLRTRLGELRKQRESEQADIYYGLTDNTRLNQLNAEIAETEQKLRKQVATVEIYNSMIGRTNGYMRGNGYGGHKPRLPYAPGGFGLYNHDMIHYCCAPVSGLVIEVLMPSQIIAFKEELIMKLQPTDYLASNFGVMAYVPSDKVKYLQTTNPVDIIVNSDITLQARLVMIGVRVEEIPKHLQSSFAHDTEVVLAYFDFLPYQTIPRWITSSHLPVRVKVNKFKSKMNPKKIYYYTIPDSLGRTEPPSVVIDGEIFNSDSLGVNIEK